MHHIHGREWNGTWSSITCYVLSDKQMPHKSNIFTFFKRKEWNGSSTWLHVTFLLPEMICGPPHVYHVMIRDCRPTARIPLRLLDWTHMVTALQLIWLYVRLCVCAHREEDYINRESYTIKDKELNSVIMGSMNGFHWSWVHNFLHPVALLHVPRNLYTVLVRWPWGMLNPKMLNPPCWGMLPGIESNPNPESSWACS